jgi:hypothetical protein
LEPRGNNMPVTSNFFPIWFKKNSTWRDRLVWAMMQGSHKKWGKGRRRAGPLRSCQSWICRPKSSCFQVMGPVAH